MANDLCIYYQNTRGLRTKTHSFKRNILLNPYDVVSLTETWLNDGISDTELFDDRYLVFRRDRNYSETGEKYGGGVLLAVRREFTAIDRPDWNSTAEDIWVTISYKNKPNSKPKKLHVCTIYLCDENRGYSFSAQLNNFSDRLSHIINSCPDDSFILLGDFNLSNVDWVQNGNIIEPTGVVGEAQIYFIDTLTECNLNQYNLCRNINNRLLDLALSNMDLTVSCCGDPIVPEDAHHKSLRISSSSTIFEPLKANRRLKYFYNKGDYDKINEFLGLIDWEDSLNNKPLEEALDLFYKYLYDAIDKYIPQKQFYPSSYPPWYNTSLIKILKEKSKYLKKYRTYGNISDYNTFSLLRRRAKSTEEICYRDYLRKTEESITDNPKLFWSFIKANKKGSNALPSSLSYNGITSDSGEGICNLFATYFQSTFLSAAPTNRNCRRGVESSGCHSICDVEVTADVVLKLLQSIDLSKGAGPDHISPLFISRCAVELTKPLTILFKRSLKEGIIPKIWKSAFVTPVHKSGSRNEVTNYRPISKLCLFAKVLERVVHSQLYSALTNFFIPEQHGFLKRRSTATNLLSFTDFVTSNMDSGGQVDSIFTDYSKAFDRIDHVILLDKLLAAGIHGNLLRWFSSYIENRSQVVAVSGYSSKWHTVPSGVPQGSLLGPLLFNIFVNDIKSCFRSSQFLLYADDMKIFRKIETAHDCYLLQQDLVALEDYCSLNKLDLNVSKCFSITFTRKPNPILYDYTLKTRNLKRVNEIKDLGVIHDTKFTYEKHINAISKKAIKVMGFVIRSCSQFSSIKIIKILYCSFVRSALEYCSQIWCPQYGIYINRLETIQRKFMRFLQYKCNQYDTSYESRCKRHHILPLMERRKIADTVLYVKIAQSLVDCPNLLSSVKLRVPNRSVRRLVTLFIPQSHTKYRHNSFLVRTATQVNRLLESNDLDLFNSKPSKFKQAIASGWFESVS